MAKRVFKTYLFLVGVSFILLTCAVKIEYGVLSPVECLIASLINTIWYLIVVFISTRKYPGIMWLIILILCFLIEPKYTTQSSMSIFSILSMITGGINAITAIWQAEQYKEEKRQKDLKKTLFSDVDVSLEEVMDFWQDEMDKDIAEKEQKNSKFM